jgi:hypothetical protein
MLFVRIGESISPRQKTAVAQTFRSLGNATISDKSLTGGIGARTLAISRRKGFASGTCCQAMQDAVRYTLTAAGRTPTGPKPTRTSHRIPPTAGRARPRPFPRIT